MSVVAISLALAAVTTADARDNALAEQRELYASYAACRVRDLHDQSAKAVLSDLDDAHLQRRFGDIFFDKPVLWVNGCRELFISAASPMLFGGEPLRAALAEALVKADLRNDTTESFADRAPLLLRQPESRAEFAKTVAGVSSEKARQRLQDDYDARIAQSWLWRFGECVVRGEPARARYWLLSKAGTPNDAAALRALSPAFGACLAEGKKLSVSKDMLRGAVAVSYYRLARAPVVVFAGVTH